MIERIKTLKNAPQAVIDTAQAYASNLGAASRKGLRAVRMLTGLHDFSKAFQAAKRGEYSAAAYSTIEGAQRLLGVAAATYLLYSVVHTGNSSAGGARNFQMELPDNPDPCPATVQAFFRLANERWGIIAVGNPPRLQGCALPPSCSQRA